MASEAVPAADSGCSGTGFGLRWLRHYCIRRLAMLLGWGSLGAEKKARCRSRVPVVEPEKLSCLIRTSVRAGRKSWVDESMRNAEKSETAYTRELHHVRLCELTTATKDGSEGLVPGSSESRSESINTVLILDQGKCRARLIPHRSLITYGRRA